MKFYQRPTFSAKAPADSWAGPVSADWADGAAWSLGTPPGASQAATIAAAGQYTVTIDSEQAVKSLTIDAASATVADSAALSIGTSLSVASGSFVLEAGGDIVGGSISVGSSGAFVIDGGALTRVTFAGAINLTAANASLTLSGTTLTGASDSGAGTINLTGAFSSIAVHGALSGAGVINETGAYDDLAFYGSRTLDAGTLNIGSGNYTAVDVAGTATDGATLTLGGGYLINVVKFGAYINLDNANDVLVNQGTIDAASVGAFALGNGTGTIINQGTIAVGNGSQTTIAASMFSNSGTVTVSGSNSLLFLEHWTNTGIIEDMGGALLVLGGVFSSAALETITDNGIINIVGLMTNSGNTLSVGAGSMFGSIVVTGGIAGGTIADSGGGLVSTGGTLTDVTYEGVLNVGNGLRGAGSATLTLTDSRITGIDGSGPGTLSLTGASSTVVVHGLLTGVDEIDDTGAGASMIFYDTRTLDDGTLNIGSGSSSYLEVADDTGHGATLTLGSQFVVNAVAAGASLYLEDFNDALINQGDINDASAGGFVLGAGVGTIVNQGSITVSNNATMTMEAARVVNDGSLDLASNSTLVVNSIDTGGASLLSAGSFEVGAGSLLQIDNDPLISSDHADITLNGEGSLIQSLDTSSGQLVSLDMTLARIAEGGTLSLLGGRDYTAAANQGRFADDGVLNLGGGTFTAQSLIVAHGGTLEGTGTIAGVVSDAGTIAAAGGTLSFSGHVFGHGMIVAAAGSTIEFDGGAILSPAITGGGTLALNGSARYALDGRAVRISNVLIGAGADVSGGARFLGALTNNGSVFTSAGSTLMVVGSVGGTGSFTAQDGALLDFRGGGDLTQTISGHGLLKLQGSVGFSLSGQSIRIGTMVVTTYAVLSGFGAIASKVYDRGSIIASGGTLTLQNAVSGHGTLAAAAGAVMDIAGDTAFGGTLGGAGTILCAGDLTLTERAVLSAATIIDSGDVRLGTDTDLTNALGSSFVLSAPDGSQALLSGAPSAEFANAGNLVLAGGTGDVTVDVVNSGSVSVGSGALAFLAAVTNTGTMAAAGGVLSFAATVMGAGTLTVSGTGQIALRDGVSVGQTIEFLGSNGVLDLGMPSDFAGSIVGFGAGDSIDLLRTPQTGDVYAGGVLAVFNGATCVARLHFGGDYASSNFVLGSDGHGGTLITYFPT